MSESTQANSQPSYFNLHVEGVGYLNRVRTVKPKKGQEFLACTVAALRGRIRRRLATSKPHSLRYQ